MFSAYHGGLFSCAEPEPLLPVLLAAESEVLKAAFVATFVVLVAPVLAALDAPVLAEVPPVSAVLGPAVFDELTAPVLAALDAPVAPVPDPAVVAV